MHRGRGGMVIIRLMKVIVYGGAILSLARGSDDNSQEGEGASCYTSDSTDNEGTSYRNKRRAPVVWVHGELKPGQLKHVETVFERLGFVVTKHGRGGDWDVMWHHQYPFVSMGKAGLTSLRPHQMVNHFPGIHHIANKRTLATTLGQTTYIPKAFSIPRQRDDFLRYAQEHPELMWVQKNIHNRGVQIKSVEEIDLESEKDFVQEYIGNPILVDGRKFDPSIYTIMTSLDPLRVYMIEECARMRFCTKDYHPFDPRDRAKYVVSDDFTNVWDMPSLRDMYTNGNYGYKVMLNHYLSTHGWNVTQLWRDMQEIILDVYTAKQNIMIQRSSSFTSSRHFFELVRFDFLLHETGKVYLMEVNMSPNLVATAGDDDKYRHVYENIVYNFLRVARISTMPGNRFHTSDEDTQEEMLVSDRAISVFVEWCAMERRSPNCARLEHALCGQCLDSHARTILKEAYLEHINRGECRRVFPPPMSQEDALAWSPDNDIFGITKMADNQLMCMWFVGMCRKDVTWCT